MKNKMRKSLTLLLVIGYLLFVAGCQSPVSTGDKPIPPVGKGSVSLTLSGVSRTILPATLDLNDFAGYNLAFTATGSGAVSDTVDRDSDNYGAPIDLIPGTYSLTVNAYKDTGKTILLASGATASDFTVTVGKNNPVTITLKLLTTGTGTFSWDITIPPSAGFATMTATKDGGGAEISNLDLTDNVNKLKSQNLDSGKYTVTFNMTDNGGKTFVWEELLYVYDNLESAFVYEFTDEYFIKDNYTVTFDRNGGDDGDGLQTLLHGQMLAPQDANRLGYEFKGWWTGDGTGHVWGVEWDFGAPVIESFTLYARWQGIDVEGVSLDQSAVNLVWSGSPTTTITLTATLDPPVPTIPTVTWASDNTLVATVSSASGTADGDGEITVTVTILAPGTATITVTSDDTEAEDGPFSATCVITVKQSEAFDITFEQIADKAPVIFGPTISLTNTEFPDTATLTVTNPEDYSSINWYINGRFRGRGVTYTLNSADTAYNREGQHRITVEVVKDGVRYNKTITFTVAE